MNKLIDEYSMKLSPILVGDENPETLYEPSLYNNYCLEDVKRIAPNAAIDFGGTSYQNKSLVNLANSVLASVPSENFTKVAKLVIFSGKTIRMNLLICLGIILLLLKRSKRY